MNDTKSLIRSKTDLHGFESSPQPRLSADEVVAAAAQQRFSESCYFALRGVLCEYHQGMFVLRGKVPSFYTKQLAQEMVRKIEGVGAVVNALEVGD